MGRYRRDNKQNKFNDSKTTASQKKTRAVSFTVLELHRIESYLLEYREGCYRCHDDKNDKAHYSSFLQSTAGFTIGVNHISFPSLTDQVLSQPCLALSSEMSNAQRKQIHQICIKLDLFHETSKVADRKSLLVSIYQNGLDAVMISSSSVDNEKQEQTWSMYRPWCCLRENRINMSSHNEAHQKLYALMDQPSTCLRETLDSFNYHDWQDFDLSQVPPPSDDFDNWTYVETLEQLKECRKDLLTSKTTELSFDLEFWNLSKHVGRTCLLQLSSNAGKSYIIDVLKPEVWANVGAELREFFENPEIVKIGHSISGDVKCLHRDFGIHVMNAFDTYEAASRVLKIPGNLAALCMHYGLHDRRYTELKQKYQTSDWRHRPLCLEQMEYARYDVHYLISLRILLIRDLIKHDLWLADSQKESQNVADALRDTLRSIQMAEGDVDECDVGKSNPLTIESNLSFSSDEDDQDGFHTPQEEEQSNQNDSSQKRYYHTAKVEELRMQPDLMQVLSLSQQRCCENLFKEDINSTLKKHSMYVELVTSEENFLDLRLLDQLLHWRTNMAHRYECLEGIICSQDQLLYLAWKRPTSITLLQRLWGRCSELTAMMICNESSKLLELIAEHSNAKDLNNAREDPPLYQSRQKKDRNYWRVLVTIAATVGVLYVVLRRPRK